MSTMMVFSIYMKPLDEVIWRSGLVCHQYMDNNTESCAAHPTFGIMGHPGWGLIIIWKAVVACEGGASH